MHHSMFKDKVDIQRLFATFLLSDNELLFTLPICHTILFAHKWISKPTNTHREVLVLLRENSRLPR